jgi:hypothetical protein
VAAKNPSLRSSYSAAVVHNEQARSQAGEMALSSDPGIHMKAGETRIWDLRIAGHTEEVKAHDSSAVSIVGRANHRDKKKAVVILIS